MDSLDREIHANLVQRQSNEFKKLASEDKQMVRSLRIFS